MNGVNPKWLLILVATLSFLAVCGCGTVSTRTKGFGGPYSGVGYDLERVGSAEEWCEWSVQGSASDIPFFFPRGLLWALDTPLSIVADTILLPADALRSPASKPEESDEGGQDDSRGNAVLP